MHQTLGRRGRKIALGTLAALVATTLTACGSDDGAGDAAGGGEQGTTQEPARQTALERDPANASKGTITVGSKNFTEQFILGEIYAQSLEALGFKVRRRLNLGSEQIAFRALKSGQIDAYPEYTGTALTSFFDVKTADVPRDPNEAYELAKREYAQVGIQALPRTPFENTFRITSTVEQAQKLGNPTTLSELMQKDPNLSVSGFPECRQRTDCLLGLRDTYGFKGEFVSSEGKFEDLDNGQSDLTFAFSTDAQLALTKKYYDYEDDKKLFPPYNISFGVSDELAQKLGPQGLQTIVEVQKGMTEEAMRELNRRVDLEKQQPEEVAAAYLSESGYVR